MISIAQFGIGAVIAAAIAGAFSIIGMIVAKEHKVSEFRRDWLESLRSEIARYIAHVNLFVSIMKYSNSDEDTVTEFRLEMIAMSEAATMIRLKLDEADEDAIAFLQDMSNIESEILAGNEGAIEAISRHEALLVKRSRALLRRQWQRVRDGEPPLTVGPQPTTLPQTVSAW